MYYKAVKVKILTVVLSLDIHSILYRISVFKSIAIIVPSVIPSVIICLFDQCTANYLRRSANILRTINTLLVVSIDLLRSMNLQMYLKAASIARAHLLTIKLLAQYIHTCMIKK